MSHPARTHYDVLGVAPDSSAEELRRAYLREARTHHPDRGGPDAAERMREVNAAWEVLGDPERRARYDAEVGLAPPGGRTVIRRPDATFVPLDPDDDEPPEFDDGPGDPRTSPGRAVLVPVVLTGASLLVGLAWMVLDDDRFLAVAVILGVLAAVSMFMVPLVAMTRAARFERR